MITRALGAVLLVLSVVTCRVAPAQDATAPAKAPAETAAPTVMQTPPAAPGTEQAPPAGERPARQRRDFGPGPEAPTKAPDWWLAQPDQVEKFLRSLPGVTVFEIGKSAGGRPIIAAAYGEREDLPGRTSKSLASAIAGGDPTAFYGKGQRKHQSFVFLGAAHSSELEGSVAAINMLNVIVTGKDLRGKEWPRMAEGGRNLRLVIIPFYNIDGRARFPQFVSAMVRRPEGGPVYSDQGTFKNGTRLGWPGAKLYFPLPMDQVDVLGSYYNDNGVNLVYDFGFGGEDCQPETKALCQFLREEMPDCVLCSHSDSGSLVEPPSSFVPDHYRFREIQLGAMVSARCLREGAKISGLNSRQESYAGQQFYQTDLIYHVCGAFPVLVEFPRGNLRRGIDFDEVLNIGMYILDEVLAYGNRYGFRPRDPKMPG